MGANNSTRRVSFESDENENITVVKGIRLSENVINRMRESSASPKQQKSPTQLPSTASTLAPSPPLRPVPPPFHPINSLSPPPPVAPPAPFSTDNVAAPPRPSPQPPTEQVAAPTIAEMLLPSSLPPSTNNNVAAPAFEVTPASPSHPPAADNPVNLPVSLPTPPASAHFNPLIPAPFKAAAVVEDTPLAPSPHAIEPSAPTTNQPIAPSCVSELLPPPLSVKIEPNPAHPLPESEPLSSPPVYLPTSLHPSGNTLSPQPAKPFAAPPLPEFIASCDPVAPHPQPPEKPVSPAPVSEPVSHPVHPAAPTVDEEALRKKITDELYKGLEQERAKAEQELQAWLEAEKARASAQAHAEAQSQVQDEVSRIPSAQRGMAQESLQQAIIRESIALEHERRRAQLYAKQLDAREADLKKQDAFYREQVARLEERNAQFYKVTTENFHNAADQVNAKFRRYEMHPVCADLQGQILACYKENVGKTLHCSNIAALYLQCVNNAKQTKLRTGG